MSETTTVRFRDSAEKHLEVFENSWRTPHPEATTCLDCEEFIAEAVTVYQFMDNASFFLRRWIYRGVGELTPADGDWERALFTRWLQAAEPWIPELERLEAEYGPIAGAAQFQECVNSCRRFLAAWSPPPVARAVGSRDWNMTLDEVAELKALLRTPVGQPGRMTRSTRSVPLGNLSDLK